MSKSQVKRKLAQGAYEDTIKLVDDLLRADHQEAPYMARRVVEAMVYAGWTPPADKASSTEE